MRLRLQQAAVKLFQERGYERTKATDIAAAVGVTERTFFRHFPDKREVLFDGQTVLLEALDMSMTSAPPDLDALGTLFRAFRSTIPLLQANRGFAEPRQSVISSTPALHERELAKHEALSEALAIALRARGVPDMQATLAAQAGMAAFTLATTEWLKDDSQDLEVRLSSVEGALRALL